MPPIDVETIGVSEMVALLDRGISLNDRTIKGNALIRYMDATVLETLMDDCVTFNCQGDDVIIDFNYEHFVPNRHDNEVDKQPDEVGKIHSEVESTVLAYMSRSHKFKHLLQHPLMVAYVTIKWQELCKFRLFNFVAYLSFAFYVMVQICYDYPFHGNWFSLFVTILGLIPTILSLCVNFTSVENWMGLTASVTLISLFWLDDKQMPLLFAVVILIGVKVFMMFGTFYAFAIYVDMFKIVVANFCKFLLFYLVLLVALTLCFHISVMKRQEGATASSFLIFIKPFNLLIANSEDDDFDNTSITGILVHLFFIFMLPVVMSNLLIGLAVSDITDIRFKAEMAFCCGRVQYVQAVEILHRDFKFLGFFLNFMCGRPAIFRQNAHLTAIVVAEDSDDYSFCITPFTKYYYKKMQKKTLGCLKCGQLIGLGGKATEALNDLCEKKFASVGKLRDFIISDCYFV